MAVVRKVPARVTEVNCLASDVFTYVFAVEGRTPRFKPGQFLHLALDEYDPSRGWPESRVFSVASSPTRPDALRLMIAVKGRFTRRIAEELSVGCRVWLKLPYGEFTFDDADYPIILIAGGTGIAPFASYLEYCLHSGVTRSLRLYYGARNEKLLACRRLVDTCRAELPGFRGVMYAEDGGDRVLAGVPDIDTIMAENDGDAPAYFLSGPWPMIESFRGRLLDAGIAVDRIRVDDWQ